MPIRTLVGAGLRSKTEFRRPLSSLISSDTITHIPESVKTFAPKSSSITTSSGRTVAYDALVVAAGLKINWDTISGLSKALAEPGSGVSSIYSYDVDFYTGMPSMFSVKKYSDALNDLRIERGVGGFFQHNLHSIDTGNRKATFKRADGTTVDVDYTLLHVTPPMGPLDFLKESPIVDATGWVEVNKDTLQHVKPEFSNIFALGDCSSLPTSKTAAAITSQAPVLTENLFSVIDTGKVNSNATYDGYTSCPLITGYGELMLAEFKYGLEPKESFSNFFDQTKPNRLDDLHLVPTPTHPFSQDFFPAVYWERMVKGGWFGPNGMSRPTY
ncbi:hypothetical protein HWV62_17577 [Athelia sp. TMB]|nr:hypothetical protein HWV62_39215 [Athelia sp. TMB]KAF7984047.1 hypothetical protein HWV62_17577 [Athelia sp. TMB]